MFFESSVKKKQIVLSSTSPRFDSKAQKKQKFGCDFGVKTEQNKVEENSQLINRSKSQKQFATPNSFASHLKHPILSKQKIDSKHYINSIKAESQIFLKQHKQPNIQNGRLNIQQKYLKKTENCDRQNDRITDINEFQLKHSKKKTNGYFKLMSNRQAKDSCAKSNYPNCNPFNSSSKNSQISEFKERNQMFNSKKGLTSTLPSHFSVDKIDHEYFEEDLSKILNQNNQLKLMITNLERQVSVLLREKDKDKSKLLECSITIDKLKFQNDCLRKSATKTKQNLDSKGREAQYKQIYELRKMVKQEIDSKQILERQKKNILSQLSQTLANFEAEKVRWQRQKKTMQNKLDVLILQIKQRKNENLTLAQRSVSVCSQNKKYKQSIERYQKKLNEKQKEVQWMNSKVGDLKQVLQNLKTHEKNRKKHQDQSQSQNKMNQNPMIVQLQAKILEKQRLIVQLRQQIQKTSLAFNNLNQQAKNLKIQREEFQQLKKKTETQLRAQIQQIKKKREKEEKAHDQYMMQKNKVIQALAKNLSDLTIKLQESKKERIKFQNQINQHGTKSEQNQQQIANLTKQIQELKSCNQQYLRKIYKIERQCMQVKGNLRKQVQKSNNYQNQKGRLQKQVQRYKSYWENLSQQNRLKQAQIKNVSNKSTTYQQQLQIMQAKNEQLRKQLQHKEKSMQRIQKQYNSITKQWVQTKYKLQCANKDLQAKSRQLGQKQRMIKCIQESKESQTRRTRQIQQELKTTKIAFRQLQHQHNIAINTNKKSQQINSSTLASNTYSQLQMRLCSVLGIYLTTNIEKIVNPIQQLMKSKRKLQVNANNYQQILKVFQVKDNSMTAGLSRNLVSQMRLYKTNYEHIVQLNKGQEQQLVRLRRQNSFLTIRFDQTNCHIKKIEAINDQCNHTIMKLLLKIGNQKYSCTGTRKY